MPKCKFLKKGFKVEQRGKITVSSKICQKGAQLVLLLGKTQANNIFWGLLHSTARTAGLLLLAVGLGPQHTRSTARLLSSPILKQQTEGRRHGILITTHLISYAVIKLQRAMG